MRSLSRLFNASLSTQSGGPATRSAYVPTFMHHDGADPSAVSAYAEYYHSICKRGAYSRNEPVGAVYYDYKYLTENDIARDEYYDFLNRNGGKYAMGATLAKPGATQPKGDVLQCAVHFSSRHGHPGDDKIDIFRRLVPHIMRAVQINQSISRHQIAVGDALAALYQSRNAILGLDENLNVVLVSETAERILTTGDGLTVRGGRLSLVSTTVEKELYAAMATMVSTERDLYKDVPSAFAVQRLSGERPLVLFLAPIAPPAEAADVGITGRLKLLVTIRDLAFEPSVSKLSLTRVFGLTNAECELSLALARGEKLSDYCDRLDLSIETARWHLNNVFSKTGTNRQTELALLVRNLASSI